MTRTWPAATSPWRRAASVTVNQMNSEKERENHE